LSTIEVPPQRQRLARALKRLRVAADLSTYELAERLGLSQSRVSRVENARSPARVAEVERWATVTAASAEQRQELIEWAKEGLTASTSWETAILDHLPRLQEDVQALEASAGSIKVYQPLLVPGLLQTPQYARQVFTTAPAFSDQDVAERVAARMNRQAILYDENKRFAFVIPEAALRWRFGLRDMLLGQLDRLSVVATLPNVELGIIPQAGEAPVWRSHGFVIFDNRGDEETFVHVELLGTWLTISGDDKVNLYKQAFDRLRSVAVSGEDALAILRAVADDTRHRQ
jgi:transcriptional regulator with XRE-family HTH domain